MPPLNTFSRTCLALAIGQAIITPANAATIEVNTTDDPAATVGTCSLRQAIVSANTDSTGTSNCVAGTGVDYITFANSVVAGGIITLTQPVALSVTQDLVINGPYDALMVINGMGNAGVFSMNNTTVSLNNLTITGGYALSYGGGIYAISSSSVSLMNSTVIGNTAYLEGGGIAARTSSSVSLINSTVTGNSSSDLGGGIAVDSSYVSLINSTVSGNSADSYGGGIYANSSSSVSLINSTVTGNSVNDGGGGIDAYNTSTISLKNSIVAGNDAPTGAEINDYNGNSTFNTDHNVLGDSSHNNAQSFYNFTPDVTTDITATSDSIQGDPTALSSIINSLADNGGATETHALVVGSPALDVADGTVCTTSPIDNEDQRGFNRNSVCDIGAFETQTIATITVDSSLDNGVVSASSCSLRNAITSSNTESIVGGCASLDFRNSSEIIFDSVEFPVGLANTITLTSSLPTISSNITITGHGASGLTIDANKTGRVFKLQFASVSLNNLTITGGVAPTYGGGIYAKSSSSVSLMNSTVIGNSADYGGGGIDARTSSSVSLINSTVTDNSSSDLGGGIAVDSSYVSLINSTVSGNSADSYGGGIYANSSSVSLINSTVTGNSANDGGGGIDAYTTSTISLKNSIVAGNDATTGAEINDYSGDSTFITNHNLLGDSSHNNAQSFYNFTPDVTTDITATSDSTQGDPTALSSIISSLADNGGATKTHALVIDSPAVDAGDNALCAADPINNLDQRGEVRPDGSDCDIGSFEGIVEDTQFFVVPLANGKAVIFSL